MHGDNFVGVRDIPAFGLFACAQTARLQQRTHTAVQIYVMRL
jgi:hypothetical protein